MRLGSVIRLKRPVATIRLKTVEERTKPVAAPVPEKPRKPKGFDYRDDPRDMDAKFLLDLAIELNTRICGHLGTDQRLLDRSKELKKEVLRRMSLVPK